MAYPAPEVYSPFPGEELRDTIVEKYRISNMGRLVSYVRVGPRGGKPRVIRSYDKWAHGINEGYQVVDMKGPDGKKIRKCLHTLVLTSFVGPRPKGHDGCHLNDNPRDNRLENLRWKKREGNIADRMKNSGYRNAGAPGKAKTEEHKQKIRDNMKRVWAERKAAQARGNS